MMSSGLRPFVQSPASIGIVGVVWLDGADLLRGVRVLQLPRAMLDGGDYNPSRRIGTFLEGCPHEQ